MEERYHIPYPTVHHNRAMGEEILFGGLPLSSHAPRRKFRAHAWAKFGLVMVVIFATTLHLPLRLAMYMVVAPNHQRSASGTLSLESLTASVQHDSSQTTNQQAASVQSLPPKCTVIVPAYKASSYLPRLMETFQEQTYPNLELMFSIEPSADADETEQILRSYQADIAERTDSPIRNIHIYRQRNQLFYFDNMNFLLSKLEESSVDESPFYSYMQVDDLLSPNYYEVLIQCLLDNPQAVNCFPCTMTHIAADDFFKQKYEGKNITLPCDPSIAGPQHVRVEDTVLHAQPGPNRGVVRRPTSPGQRAARYPRLYQNFGSTDHAIAVQHAIVGDLVAVKDVGYFKYMAFSSAGQSEQFNTTKTSLEDFKRGWVDNYAHKYNLAHSYALSSQDLAQATAESVKTHLKAMMMWRADGSSLSSEKVTKIQNEGAREFLAAIQKPKRVAILGAGIQGSLMALMFRKHGYEVTLIDKAADIMTRTSTTGEGRIHLGLEYANDPSMDTAAYMLRSSMRFASYTEYLVGHEIDWKRLRSERLLCLLPHTSHVSPAEFEAYGEKLGRLYEDVLEEDPTLTYLGERPPKILIGRTPVPSAVNSSYIQAAYKSIEVCILSKPLQEILREALYKASVQLVLNREVFKVERKPSPLGQFHVTTNIGTTQFDAVVNCLWESRADIDSMMGLSNRAENESYRVKANVRLPNLLPIHGDIPSVSIMNGPFGDFVRYGPNDQVYFAWHPLNSDFISHNATLVREKYERHAMSDFPPGYEDKMIEGHRRAFEQLFPGYNSSFFDEAVVGTGYVVANGLVDIHDAKSQLHTRKDPPNVVQDGYVSVKTQKLTSAPYNTYLLEQELFMKDSFVS